MFYNDFYNILRVFDALPKFFFCISEIYAIITYKYGIYKMLHKLLNNLRLRILEN